MRLLECNPALAVMCARALSTYAPMQALGAEKDVLAAELHKAQAALKGSGQEEVRVAALQKKAEDSALEVTNLQQLLAGASKEIEALHQVVRHPCRSLALHSSRASTGLHAYVARATLMHCNQRVMKIGWLSM